MGNDYKKDDKPKTEAPAKSAAEEMREAIADGIAMGIAVAAKGNTPAPTQTRAQARQKKTCGECKQDLRGCEGKHRLMVVYPKKNGRYFQGVIINGVRYLSNNKNHKICVPANADISNFISNWEDSEEAMKESKSREHNSGELSGSGRTSFNPAVGIN